MQIKPLVSHPLLLIRFLPPSDIAFGYFVGGAAVALCCARNQMWGVACENLPATVRKQNNHTSVPTVVTPRSDLAFFHSPSYINRKFVFLVALFFFFYIQTLQSSLFQQRLQTDPWVWNPFMPVPHRDTRLPCAPTPLEIHHRKRSALFFKSNTLKFIVIKERWLLLTKVISHVWGGFIQTQLVLSESYHSDCCSSHYQGPKPLNVSLVCSTAANPALSYH